MKNYCFRYHVRREFSAINAWQIIYGEDLTSVIIIFTFRSSLKIRPDGNAVAGQTFVISVNSMRIELALVLQCCCIGNIRLFFSKGANVLSKTLRMMTLPS
ncbi:hypothetical protein NPIL_82581 [Nephila pilipes]|uniref:Uncharacterized protein n=1 Tax=Nephila pilipes TaxID=299642 RepID=A0A8X6PHN9_NEPPI|nr:hypothetical protein NPIL_82581 [Nephila pilipes]